MDTEIYKKIGKNIKKRRKELGYTQQELADKIGKGLNFLGKVEIAFSKPSLDTLIDISKALDIKLKDLLDFDEKS
ncbi:MAG: helix-turn-helix transcriptional regulator [Candidatus Gastranaerophilales bacterium]|nr:helix-turn-helix transcriptional regulator [Candidatus Gastranaerophilales bacterium]